MDGYQNQDRPLMLHPAENKHWELAWVAEVSRTAAPVWSLTELGRGEHLAARRASHSRVQWVKLEVLAWKGPAVALTATL